MANPILTYFPSHSKGRVGPCVLRHTRDISLRMRYCEKIEDVIKQEYEEVVNTRQGKISRGKALGAQFDVVVRNRHRCLSPG
jgi:hypothetical protein